MGATVYDIITEKIVTQLEEGTVPWHRPWSGGEPPKNLISKKPYRGINIFLLAAAGYASPYWLTFNQVKGLDGSIKKGSKSTMVIFWKKNSYKKVNDQGEEETKQSMILRYYRVFNTEQTTGIKEGKIPEMQVRDFEPIEECERIFENMPSQPNLTFDEQQAYFRPSTDTVNMPKPETFSSEEEYYSTLFHEITHATGHDTRLGRHKADKCTHNFGSKDYSKEELIAEMGAAFLCGHCGIDTTIDNSAAYIKGWLSKLRNDTKVVIMAAGKAQKASDYILGNE